MKFTDSEVLLSFMSFRVLKAILKREEKEYTWFQNQIKNSFLRIQKVIDYGNRKDWSEEKIRKEIKDIVFSEPYVGMLYIDTEASTVQEAIEESYNYLLNVYRIYVKRTPTTQEFNIYYYLKYLESSNLYEVPSSRLKSDIRKYSNPSFNSGNIEKSTLVIMSYLSKYYKNYYL